MERTIEQTSIIRRQDNKMTLTQRAKSKEQRAKSKEQRAKSKEQRAKSKEAKKPSPLVLRPSSVVRRPSSFVRRPSSRPSSRVPRLSSLDQRQQHRRQRIPTTSIVQSPNKVQRVARGRVVRGGPFANHCKKRCNQQYNHRTQYYAMVQVFACKLDRCSFSWMYSCTSERRDRL